MKTMLTIAVLALALSVPASAFNEIKCRSQQYPDVIILAPCCSCPWGYNPA